MTHIYAGQIVFFFSLFSLRLNHDDLDLGEQSRGVSESDYWIIAVALNVYKKIYGLSAIIMLSRIKKSFKMLKFILF